jgi:hypothetical protein
MLKVVIRKREEHEQRNPEGSYLQFARNAMSGGTRYRADAARTFELVENVEHPCPMRDGSEPH